jgi:SAM-dependent methyltransferase
MQQKETIASLHTSRESGGEFDGRPRPDPPLPPERLRRLVCHDDYLFNLDPTRYAVDGVPPELYDSVVDFGCGCGRIARQLIVQPAPPRRYLGVDINRPMIAWCQESLQPLREGWRFEHHDVYNKNLGPDNSPNRTQPFNMEAGAASLLIAHSVFTHLSLDQTIFYLHEVRRVLKPGGVAKTTWFLFSRQTFPMLVPQQVCLFVNEDDPTNAVIYDWEWLRQAAIDAGFRIRRIVPPGVPGHQWEIHLEARADDRPDVLPSVEDLRRGLCAAPSSAEDLEYLPHQSAAAPPQSPPFLGALLCHLRDPIGALMAAGRVCRRMVIASTPVVIGKPDWKTGFRDTDPGPEVLLRGDTPSLSPSGKPYNADHQLGVGGAYV